jgi:hypothetical protein
VAKLKTLSFSLLLFFSTSVAHGQSFAERLYELARQFKDRPNQPVEYQDVEKFIANFDVTDPTKGWKAALEYLDLGRRLPSGRADVLVFIPYDPTRSPDLHPMATRRLLECIRLFRQGVAPKILITGNAPNPHQIYKKTAEFLKSRGIPEEAIEFEDLQGRKTLSGNTYQNIEFALQALKTLGAKSAVFVSSTYQVERILRYYEKATNSGSYRLENVYWSSYYNQIDNDMLDEKRKYVLHEITAVIRDYQQFQNKLASSPMQSKNSGTPISLPITACGELTQLLLP